MTEIYCDGACKGNPGPIGSGVVIYTDNEIIEYAGQYHQDGTNNIAELRALRMAIKFSYNLKPCVIKTDSMYAINCITKWSSSWEKNNWQKKGGIKNLGLIKEIYKEYKKSNVEISHVAGHSKSIGNDKADELANKAIVLQLSYWKNTIKRNLNEAVKETN